MSQPEYDIPNPPDGGINGQPAATIDDLQAHLQAHAREHGFAVVRRNGGNYRGDPKKPTRFKARTYTEKVAELETRTRYEYLHCDWLGAVSEVGTKALVLMNRQHQKALLSLPTDARPHPPDLPPCSGTFSNQYRLPCSHKLLDMMKRKEPLTKEHIHPRWWLRQPLASDIICS